VSGRDNDSETITAPKPIANFRFGVMRTLAKNHPHFEKAGIIRMMPARKTDSPDPTGQCRLSPPCEAGNR
jgi:hypothetical protein